MFGTEQGLRYRIPFGGVEDVIDYLRAHATEDGKRVGMMGDDGEKFGAWPTTFEHCWGEGRWVERFFEALEANADWLSTVTPSQWLEREPPIGRVYVPTSSYAEMGEWALPPGETVVFTKLLHDAVAEKRPEARWLRGGFWRNFQVKYREINDLHKQMLRTSRKVAAMTEGPARTAALDHLHRGQSNDCYWHGLFGGIYISHMRLATYEHLIAAEDAADRALGTQRVAETARPRHGRAPRGVPRRPGPGRHGHAGGRRRHRLVGRAWRRGTRSPPPSAAAPRRTTRPSAPTRRRAPATTRRPPTAAHPPRSTTSSWSRRRGCRGRLFYDDHERRSALVRFLAPDETPRGGGARPPTRELGDFRDGAVADRPPRARPGLAVARGHGARPAAHRHEDRSASAATASTRRSSSRSRSTTVATRRSRRGWGSSGRSTCSAAAATRRPGTTSRGERTAHDGTGEASGIDAIGYGNDWVGVAVEAQLTPAADAWWAPIETVSNSESGFERVYQGSGLLLSWPLTLGPGESRRFAVAQSVTVARDRTAAEAAAPA